jgi:hypothetical protein
MSKAGSTSKPLDWHQRTKFITIERPLLPCPPLDATPEWYLGNTLGFFDSEHNKVWEQEIPEADLRWMRTDGRDADEFDKYFSHFEVFKDGHFGWQLRFKISHERASLWHEKMMAYIEEYHEEHFRKVYSSP